ncbi:glycosyltransferase [Martelella mangrovi]|uniref:Glycosyltransferase involved in cell wall biosynthesis n=1 Tax=Martelella mangrovi TaxID=1397477 RepID=A0ABV2IHH8_9HYPH
MDATRTGNWLRKTLKLIGKSPDIQGNIDAADLQGITGWVWNKNAPETPMVVISTLEDGSQRVALADQYRDDLMRAGIGDGCHAFTISLAGKRPHVDENGILSVQVLGTESSLEFSAGTIFNTHAESTLSTGRAEHIKAPEKLDQTPDIQGHIDAVDSQSITGWVWNRNTPEAAMVVITSLEDGTQKVALADRYRDDLMQAGIGDGCHAFTINLANERPLLDKEGKLSVQVFGTGRSFEFSTGNLFDLNLELEGVSYAALTDSDGGRIGELKGNQIPVALSRPWLESPSLLLVNGFPAEDTLSGVKIPIDAPTEQEVHRAKITGARADTNVELFGFAGETFQRLDHVTQSTPVIETGFLTQLYHATLISRQHDSVAVTCWDGAHNPIGRAKVLYDVANRKRPTVIISYLFKEFGGTIWPPILNEDCVLLTIPWERRHLYEAAIRSAGIQFNTVWICKPRLPSFQLAALVATPEARVILDFDDNEEEFSLSSTTNTTFYGKLTINLVRELIEAVPARTVASLSLQESFGGDIVRHARNSVAEARERIPAPPDAPIKVGFIGTVRPHKRLLQAAQAITRVRHSSGQPIELHVYGDVKPEQLATQLCELGVTVRSNIPMRHLNAELATFDVVLTGFPSDEVEDQEINRFQISSKIGDALAVKRPVLVPDGPSTHDLASINGVFLFNTENFEQRLIDTIAFTGKISLPAPFTLDGAYSNFAKAESEAEKHSSAAGLRTLLPELFSDGMGNRSLRKTLLLIWKQHDAGLYGRRIDQIARSHKRRHPDHDVVVLELLHRADQKHYGNGANAFDNDSHQIFALSELKETGRTDIDGIKSLQVIWNNIDEIQENFTTTLIANNILPHNTAVIIFPILPEIERIIPALKAYKRVVDIVDNQISWSETITKSKNSHQYLMLTQSSHAIVFNSAENCKYFEKREFLPKGSSVHIIPNWYQPPGGFQGAPSPNDRLSRTRQIAYSGNMRDRFDFDLLILLAEKIPDVKIHLIGVLRADDEVVMRALKLPNIIYHGPKSERATLELLSKMDIAIVPHRLDDVSAYMDPLKVEMYESLYLPVVTTNMPGIDGSELITIATDNDDFINKVIEQISAPRKSKTNHRKSDNAEIYERLIVQLLDQAEKG